jgi:hypothetical protein
MKLFRVAAMPVDECLGAHHDAIVFASGYERRCIHVPSRLELSASGTPVVIGFDAFQDDPVRLEHDRYFLEKWRAVPTIVSGNDEGKVYELCRSFRPANGDALRILVDYSSMSRLWYAGVLNWARYATDFNCVIVDCLYAFGRYAETRPQMVIDDILAIPGCEGGAVRLGKSVALFGLGFDDKATLCVLDRLEPDIVYCFLASPASSDPYPARVRDANAEIIKHAREVLELPLGNVERSYGSLVEVVTPHLPELDITLVPMGPKPHVLAAVLLAMRFEEVACLRVSGKRSAPEAVDATGKIVATRVEFRREKSTASAHDDTETTS